MAISELFNTLTFGEVNSGDYGIYISGGGVFNAPTRSVEMISVPGRNGDVALDLGRYENITVEYPAGVFGGDNVDFREKLSDFRNAILSQKGYQRLTDTYHPDEFRMGIYASGLSVEPVHYNEAGQFTLTFNCKPQRFLVEGEEVISVSDGDTITNPTLFESGPRLEVEGNGQISFNGYTITLSPGYYGDVEIGRKNSQKPTERYNRDLDLWESIGTFPVDTTSLNPGDGIEVRGQGEKGPQISFSFNRNDSVPTSYSLANRRYTTEGESMTIAGFLGAQTLEGGVLSGSFTLNAPAKFAFGIRSELYASVTFTYDVYYLYPMERYGTNWVTIRFGIRYNGADEFELYAYTVDSGVEGDPATPWVMGPIYRSGSFSGVSAIGDSTKSRLGHPTVIDCDLGEAFKTEDGEIFSLNQFIDLGSDLPNFAPGENEISASNTITSIDIIPRWWKL